MLADIADAHKMARTTDHQRLSPPESADIVALQNFAKALVTAPAILLRPNETKRTVQQPGVGSIGNQNNELTIPTPENGALYAPVEVHRILKQLEGKQRYSTIKMMIEKGTILCKTSQIYRMLKLDESELKPWWNVRGRPAILDEATLDENIKKLDTSVGMSFGRDEVRELLHSAKAKRVGKEGFVPSINVSVSEKTVKNTMALLLASNSKATDSTKKLSQRPTDDTLPIRPNQWLEKPCGSQEG